MAERGEWLTIEQCAQEIQVSHMTIRRLIARGELTAHRFGRQWRINRQDWQNFIKTQEHSSNS